MAFLFSESFTLKRRFFWVPFFRYKRKQRLIKIWSPPLGAAGYLPRVGWRRKIVFREIFLEFREISWNTKSNFRRNYRNFATHEIKIWETFLQKNMIFNRFLKIKNKIYIKSDHIVRSPNPNRFWPFFIWGKERVVFLTF